MAKKPEPDEGSTKPYLLRAIYEWALDHHLTPQVLVDAAAADVAVPQGSVRDGRIVLTIHPQSVKGLDLGNEHLLFSARFAGKPFDVSIPVAAVLAIYGRENGQGIVFHTPDEPATDAPEDGSHKASKDASDKSNKPSNHKSNKPAHLTLVK